MLIKKKLIKHPFLLELNFIFLSGFIKVNKNELRLIFNQYLIFFGTNVLIVSFEAVNWVSMHSGRSTLKYMNPIKSHNRALIFFKHW